MKNTNRIISAAMCLLFTISLANGQTKTDDSNKFKTSGLDWFAGCWELNVAEREMRITEIWTRPEGGTLIGASRTVVKGKTVSYEYLRVVETSDGGIEYIAKPSTNPGETAFKLKSFNGDEVIFENTAHDFPQRIIYRKGTADSLFARIEGQRNGEMRGMDIPMKRISCN